MKKLILENTFSWNYKLKKLNEARLTRGEMLNKLRSKQESQHQQQIKDELEDPDISAEEHLHNIMLDKDSLVAYYNKLYNEMENKLRDAIIQNYIIKKGEDPNSQESINFIEDTIQDIINNPDSNKEFNKLSFEGPEEAPETSEDDIDWSEEAIDKYLSTDIDDPRMTTRDFSAIAKWKKDKRPVASYVDDSGEYHQGKGIPKFR